MLLVEEVTVFEEYLDFANVFLEKSTTKLPKYISINNYAIDLEEGKELYYGPIHSLGSVELEILKTYIKTNLANGFIHPSKFPTGILILFVQKPNGSL